MMKPFLKGLLLIILFFISIFINVNGQIVINEFMSNNTITVADADGDFTDWIELYNTSNSPINLLDYSLSDKSDNLDKWKFPELTIAPNSFITVFASEKDRLDINELHTNFKIASSGETLFLSNNIGQVIDQIAPIELEIDKSYGRSPDGSDNLLTLVYSSPSSSNNINNQLTFTYNGGFYKNSFYQKITSLTGDAIYFTLDGSIPTEASNIFPDSLIMDFKYTTPNKLSNIPTTPEQSLISFKAWEAPNNIIDKANILRCATFKNGLRTSEIYTHTYLVDSTIFEKYDLPIISLVTDAKNLFDPEHGIYVPGVNYDTENPAWTGNYFQRDDSWERPVHIEYFEKDGNLGFSQNAGIQIHGGKTRQAAQKSLKFYARNEYGKKHFDYPLMPNRPHKEYKRFLLKTTMGSWHDVVVGDILAHQIAKKLDVNHQDFRPVVVFINGEYWGIQTIRDRVDERYIAYSNDLDKDSLVFRGFHNTQYFQLLNFMEFNDMAIPINYDSVKTHIDIENFIDYHIAQMYLKNYDWPANNMDMWKETNPSGKWRWIYYDLDAAFGDDYDYNMFEHMAELDPNITWPNSLSSTFIYRSLIRNEEFKNQFINRYAELLNDDFQPDTLIRKLNEIIELYEPEMPRHISRWNYLESVADWKNKIDAKIITFIERRPCAVENNLINFFDPSSFDFDCVDDEIINSNKTFILAPNPNDGNFFFYNNSGKDLIGDLIITDMIGKTIYAESNFPLGKNEKKYFDFSFLPNNTYILTFKNSNFREVKKFTLIK